MKPLLSPRSPLISPINKLKLNSKQRTWFVISLSTSNIVILLSLSIVFAFGTTFFSSRYFIYADIATNIANSNNVESSKLIHRIEMTDRQVNLAKKTLTEESRSNGIIETSADENNEKVNSNSIQIPTLKDVGSENEEQPLIEGEKKRKSTKEISDVSSVKETEKVESPSLNNDGPKSIEEIKIPALYSLERASVILQPLWRCKEEGIRNGKLVFVHIFKTAGSTMRSLFRLYSSRCQASSVTVVSCSGLSEESIKGDGGTKKWKKSSGGACILKKGITRSGHEIVPERTHINTTYIQNDIDILGGHLPLGALDTLNEEQPLLYFLFVRDAMQKYVSGKMFSNRHEKLSLEQIVTLIKNHIQKARMKNEYFQNYASYLITPFQKYLHLDRNSRTQLILDNLIEYKVVIGIVDRMSESLELLHRVIDPKEEITSLFKYFGMHDSKGNKVVYNKSKFSTSSILAKLKNDTAFFPLLVEYVKYDQMIVDFARNIHLLQYQALHLSG